ncbi:hypothetical protein [Amycolatopsis taiwanensis]|uniref:hypothetical protein n=1 Tax=Amycolatopsis taiwanensis TaxID=342230 RepID=UPI0004BA0492|nr:hypothetical protein [Amycolatopsis taiwanensis]
MKILNERFISTILALGGLALPYIGHAAEIRADEGITITAESPVTAQARPTSYPTKPRLGRRWQVWSQCRSR